MSSIKDIVGDINLDSLHAVTETAGKKYLAFTRLTSEAWILCVTDGIELWRLALDQDELEAHRDLAEVKSMDAFLLKLRLIFFVFVTFLPIALTKLGFQEISARRRVQRVYK